MFIIPIVSIGNSHGIRFPQKALDAIGSPTSKVQLEIKNGALIIRPATMPRQGWDDAARWGHAKVTKEDRDWTDAPLTTQPA